MRSAFDRRDGGYTSRKLWFSAITALLIAGVGLATSHWPGIAGIYPTMVGGLLAVLAAYSGANIGAKFVVGNHLVKMGAGSAAAEAMMPELSGTEWLPGQPMEQMPPDMDGYGEMPFSPYGQSYTPSLYQPGYPLDPSYPPPLYR